MRDFDAVRRFDRNWSPVCFDELEWRRGRKCELTNAMRELMRFKKSQEEMVKGVWIVCKSAVSD